jgi:hypothetical protein
MASGIYNRFKANLFNKEVDWEADTLKVMLLDNSHVFSATDNVLADISANEISGTGYTTGGETLANAAVTQAGTTTADADDTEWTGATFTAYFAVIYDDTLAGDDLIACIDFGGAQTVTAAPFKIQWDAGGILDLT